MELNCPEPAFVTLGSAKKIDRLVRAYQRALRKDGHVRDMAKELHENVWAPLEPHLEGREGVIISPDGELLWRRSFGEEYAAFTTHGGRTMSPLIDGDLVIVGSPVSNWGSHSNRAHRFIALDKRMGEIVYVSSPGGRPYDTAYASPLIATIDAETKAKEGEEIELVLDMVKTHVFDKESAKAVYQRLEVDES